MARLGFDADDSPVSRLGSGETNNPPPKQVSKMGIGKKKERMECQTGLLEDHSKGPAKIKVVAANDALLTGTWKVEFVLVSLSCPCKD